MPCHPFGISSLLFFPLSFFLRSTVSFFPLLAWGLPINHPSLVTDSGRAFGVVPFFLYFFFFSDFPFLTFSPKLYMFSATNVESQCRGGFFLLYFRPPLISPSSIPVPPKKLIGLDCSGSLMTFSFPLSIRGPPPYSPP